MLVRPYASQPHNARRDANMRARTLILALSATMADMRPMAETVSNPSYLPRSYTLSPGAFGKVAVIAWNPIDPHNPAPAIASRIQHSQCVAIRDAITKRYETEGVAGYIRHSGGQVTDQIRRALRGDAILQPRDLAYAIHHFGDALDLTDTLVRADQ